MRTLTRTVLLAAALAAPAAAVGACGDDGQTTARPSATPVAPSLRAIVTAGAPGAIGLVGDGHRLRLHAAGVADTRDARALRPTDRFRAGSVTKSFVATVALQLVGEGRLSLSDPVERWLPGWLPNGDAVTLRHLLNHTSGVRDNQDAIDAEFIKGNMTRSWSPRELVAIATDGGPDFGPERHGPTRTRTTRSPG